MGFGDDFCWVEMHFVPPLRRCCFLVCLYLGCATYFLRSCWETSRVGREKHPKFQTWPETQQNYMAKDSGSPTKVGLLSLWSLPPKIHLSQFWMVFTACIYIIYIYIYVACISSYQVNSFFFDTVYTPVALPDDIIRMRWWTSWFPADMIRSYSWKGCYLAG